MKSKKSNTSSSSTRPKQYEEKLKVKGSFLDIMKASMKDANNKNKKKS
jgi:hypothetical protein